MFDPSYYALAAVASFVFLFVLALHNRWLGNVHHGFFYTLLLALGGAAVGSAALLATLGYESARRIVLQQRIDQMDTAANLVSNRLQDEMQDVFAQLRKVASHLTTDASGAVAARNRQELEDLDVFSEPILQIHVVDSMGRLLMKTGEQHNTPPPPPEALRGALTGQAYVSDPFFAPELKRYIMELCLPVPSVKGANASGHSGATGGGAMCVHYDLQGFLADMMHGIHISNTGYMAIADHDGHVLAHPNPAAIGHDVSAYVGVQRALRGERGWLFMTNNRQRRMVMIYLPIRTGTHSGKPWVLLAEMEVSEALEPIHELLTRFEVLTALIVIGSLLVAIGLSRYIRRPMTDLMRAVQAVEQGDLTVRCTIEGKDEFGALASSFNHMVFGLEERERIKDIFGRYVTTQVSEAVLHGQLQMGGEKRLLTVLFSDIRNFTTMSERMPAEEVVTFLNDYFTEMVDAVFEFGGVLDKFIGDGMLVEFGAFGDQPDHAQRAVSAALRMKQNLEAINDRRRRAGAPPVDIGIGIHTDEVIVGNIGSKKRLDYTVIGDGVNTASRVESLNKQFGTNILITQQTHDLLPPGMFECRVMPAADLKGKSQRLVFYEVTRRTFSGSSTSGDVGAIR